MIKKTKKHPSASPKPSFGGRGKNKKTKKQEKDSIVGATPDSSSTEVLAKAGRPKKADSVVAKGRYLRSSARKAGLVLKLIRQKPVDEAEKILQFSGKKAARLTLRVLKSAIANAKHNLNWKPEDLVIKKAVADPGPTHKRIRFGAHGRVKPILKRMCHITIELEQVPKRQKNKETKKQK